MSSTKRILINIFQCLFEMLALFPILLGLGIYIYPRLSIERYFIYIFLLCQIGSFIRGVLNIKSRWLQLLIGIGLIGIILYISEFNFLYGNMFSTVGFISYFRGVIYLEADWDGLFPRGMWWISLILYMLAAFVYSRVIILKPYISYVILCGFLQVIVSLTMLNFRQLGDATLIRDRKPVIPLYIRRQNNILLFVSIGIITIIASFHKIRELSKAIFKKILKWIVSIIEFIHSLFEGEPIPESPTQGKPELPFQGDIPSQNPILKLIFDIIAIVLLVIGIAIAIYGIYRGLRKLGSIISEWLKGLFKERDLYEESYGYIDEKESLIDIKEMRDRYTEKIKDWIENILEREPKWKDLEDNSERVRYIYRMSILENIKRGYKYKSYMTPIEVESDLEKWQGEEEGKILGEVVLAYNRVRYGYKDVEDSEVEALYRIYKDR